MSDANSEEDIGWFTWVRTISLFVACAQVGLVLWVAQASSREMIFFAPHVIALVIASPVCLLLTAINIIRHFLPSGNGATDTRDWRYPSVDAVICLILVYVILVEFGGLHLPHWVYSGRRY